MVITDMGAQFLGTWWKTMCSRLGIRRADSHVYRHQGNGKAERTGKDLKDWLSRATDGGRLNWVEFLPYVRRLMHDTPGISGYSPHRLVSNRHRHLAAVPYEGTEGAEAGEWFERVGKFEA